MPDPPTMRSGLDDDPFPEPPGSSITLAVYRVGPRVGEVLVPRETYVGFSRVGESGEPPCRCSPECRWRHVVE